MSAEHNFKSNKERPLQLALLLTGSFLIAEVIGGIMTGSLALISDAAHMLTDVVALTISLLAIRIGKRPVDAIRTFGYYRFEILAAALNAILLFFVALYIIYEAYQRLRHPPEIYSVGMLIIASIGLLVNLISMRLLTAGKNHSLNMKSAYLEVWSDMLGSLGVIVAALIIQFTEWVWVDSIIAVLIGLWVFPRTWVLLKESINVLLEGVPEGIDISALKKSLDEIEGIVDVHDMHVWAITTDKINFTAHIVTEPTSDWNIILKKAQVMLASKYNIHHTTLQNESNVCFENSHDLKNH